jgi:hypothetical protein
MKTSSHSFLFVYALLRKNIVCSRYPTPRGDVTLKVSVNVGVHEF